MGGYGSGGGGYNSKNAVEDGLTLNINFITRKQNGGARPRKASLRWLINEEAIGSIGYEILYRNDVPYLVLDYRCNGEAVHESIEIFSTRQPYGNVRWWMVCPILRNGYKCSRRCYKMYQAPGQKYFGCRSCMNLTYQSCKDSHKMDGLYARIAGDLHMPFSFVKGAMKI